MFAGCPDNAFQKVPPGYAPFTAGQRVGAVVRNGKRPCKFCRLTPLFRPCSLLQAGLFVLNLGNGLYSWQPLNPLLATAWHYQNFDLAALCLQA